MRLVSFILLCLIVGGLVIGWVLRRLGVGWGAWISFLAGLLARLVAAIWLAWSAVEVAEMGGWWYAPAAGLALLALATLGLAGLHAWAVNRYGIDPED